MYSCQVRKRGMKCETGRKVLGPGALQVGPVTRYFHCTWVHITGSLVMTLIPFPLEEFLNRGTTDIPYQRILRCEGRPVHCRIFNSISGLYSLNASSTPQFDK